MLWCITGVGGQAAVRPAVCPQPTAGATVRLVCAFSAPFLGGIHFGVAWTVWATCTLPDLWCWGSGVLAGVDRQGAQGRECQAQLAFPSEICFRRGPEAPGGSQTSRREGSAEAQLWVFARCKQVPWQELVPFGILAGGWAREMVLASAFVPRQTELCCLGSQQLSLPLSSSFSASEQSC